MIHWHACTDAASQAEALSTCIVDRLGKALQGQPHAVLAVSGGRSPIAVFERLAEAELDWGRVMLRLVDERFVDPAHPDSNARLVREHLLRKRAAVAQFQELVRAGDSLAACVEHANRHPLKPDVVVLGMGEDGHTASLFPDAAELQRGLDPANPDAYLAVHPQTAPHARISMTLAHLLRADTLLLSIAGPLKRAVLQAADDGAELPIGHLLRAPATTVEVYCAD